MGCGQGRDVIAFGRMGFTVMGIDISDVGINQLNELAQKEKLAITTAVMDYKAYKNLFEYDIVLMNSMFHFYKNESLRSSWLSRFKTVIATGRNLVANKSVGADPAHVSEEHAWFSGYV